VIALDFDDRLARLHDPEVDDGVHLYRHVVARDDVLRRDVHHDGPQADAHHAIDGREYEDYTRALRTVEELAQAEHDRALVLVQNLDRAEQVERDDDGDDQCRRHKHTASFLSCRTLPTVNRRPCTAVATTC